MDFVIRDVTLEQFCATNDAKWGVGCATAFREQVMRDYILGHVNAGVLLKHLDDVYVLVGRKSSENYCTGDEKKWNEMLNAEQMRLFNNRGEIPLAIAMITVRENFVELEHIDTFVRGFGLAEHMIAKLEVRLNNTVIPTDVRPNLGYWSAKKYLIDEACELVNYPTDKIEGYDELESDSD
jgi:hypothetical protein